MSCIAASGEVNEVYRSSAFACVVYEIDDPTGWVLQVRVLGKMTLKDIVLVCQVIREFLDSASGQVCYTIFDLRDCELFTLQQAQTFAREMNEMRSKVLSKIVCSSLCFTKSTMINAAIKRLLAATYKPARPYMVCEDGLNQAEIVRRFKEESDRLQSA